MNRHSIGFAVAGSLMTIVFLIIVNYLTSANDIWFIYPMFALLLWPGSLILIYSKKYRQNAVIGSVLIIVLLVVVNYRYASHPWSLYAVFPAIWWPLSAFYGKRAKTYSFALFASMSTIAYYVMLNAVVSPQYPWAIFPAYVVLWWPLVLYYARKKNYFGLSISASVLTILFFIVVNFVSSPHTIWAIYPIFAMSWWPLSMYFYQVKRNDQYLPTKRKYR